MFPPRADRFYRGGQLRGSPPLHGPHASRSLVSRKACHVNLAVDMDLSKLLFTYDLINHILKLSDSLRISTHHDNQLSHRLFEETQSLQEPVRREAFLDEHSCRSHPWR